ncbi:MAG: hypothetical protein ACI8RZ_007853 [Myxococcota bacterium]|jgi:hypothetical protein
MLSLILAGCAYEAPVDPDAPTVLNSITGTVVVSGADVASDMIILLFDANNPGPPEGTASPVSFSTVPAEDFSGGDGLLSAPYIMSEIPDGEWLLLGLMDVDADFHPVLSSNAGGTCGDFAGTYPVSATELSSATVTVVGGQLVEGVSVIVAAQYPTERPAFTFLDGADSIDQTSPVAVFSLEPTGIHSELVELADPGAECGVMLLTELIDADADGEPDPHLIFGELSELAFNAWPKVYIRYSEELNGVTLPEGEYYAGEVLVSPFMSSTFGGLVTPGIPTPVTQLDLLFPGAVGHYMPDGTVEAVYAPDVPTGAWEVTVVLSTGQTWTLPNETAVYPTTDGSFDPSLQGMTLTIE